MSVLLTTVIPVSGAQRVLLFSKTPLRTSCPGLLETKGLSSIEKIQCYIHESPNQTRELIIVPVNKIQMELEI